MRNICLLIFAFFLSIVSSAQDAGIPAGDSDGPQGQESTMSPGSMPKNVFKLNLASLFIGDASLHYERVFSESLSLEIGAGILLPYFVEGISNVFTDETYVTQAKSGYSFSLHPRHYLDFIAPTNLYFGLEFKHRQFNQEHGTSKHTMAAVSGGSQFVIRKNILLDLGLRFGFSRARSDEIEIAEAWQLARPLHLKLSYLFH